MRPGTGGIADPDPKPVSDGSGPDAIRLYTPQTAFWTLPAFRQRVQT